MSAVKIRIVNGNYRDADSRVVEVRNEVFDLIKGFKAGAKGGYVVVDGSEIVPSKPSLRVKVEEDDFILEDENGGNVELDESKTGVAPKVNLPPETDEAAMARIRKSFAVLEKMSDAVADGIVRGLIVSGPPGVGKSFGVENVLDSYAAMSKLGGMPPRTEVVKGFITAIGLYQTLYNNSDRGNIVLFDDCDILFADPVSLGVLKAWCTMR